MSELPYVTVIAPFASLPVVVTCSLMLDAHVWYLGFRVYELRLFTVPFVYSGGKGRRELH